LEGHRAFVAGSDIACLEEVRPEEVHLEEAHLEEAHLEEAHPEGAFLEVELLVTLEVQLAAAVGSLEDLLQSTWEGLLSGAGLLLLLSYIQKRCFLNHL